MSNQDLSGILYLAACLLLELDTASILLVEAAEAAELHDLAMCPAGPHDRRKNHLRRIDQHLEALHRACGYLSRTAHLGALRLSLEEARSIMASLPADERQALDLQFDGLCGQLEHAPILFAAATAVRQAVPSGA